MRKYWNKNTVLEFVIIVLLLFLLGDKIHWIVNYAKKYVEWGSVPEWFGAIATTSAVIVALYQNYQLRRDKDDEYNKSVHPQLKLTNGDGVIDGRRNGLVPVGDFEQEAFLETYDESKTNEVLRIKNISDNPALLLKIVVIFEGKTESESDYYVIDRLNYSDGDVSLLKVSMDELPIIEQVKVYMLTTHRERMLSVFDRNKDGFLYNMDESKVEHRLPVNIESRDDVFKNYIYNTLVESEKVQ